MAILEILSQPSDTSYILNIRHELCVYSAQHWFLCISRVPGRCSATGIEFKAGARVYRPDGNYGNRAQRLLPEAFVADAKYEPTPIPECTCVTCGAVLPQTPVYFARPRNRNEYSTTCRACSEVRRLQKKREANKRATEARQRREAHVAAGGRVVHFPDTWKPNREGMRNGLNTILGIKSSMG